jgi:Flp pilus assembly protein TadD
MSGILRKLLRPAARPAAPNDTDARRSDNARGDALYEAGRFHEARKAFLRAHRCGLSDAELYRKLGWSCIAAGASGEELTWMQRAVDADPECTKARFGYGIALKRAGRVGEAIRCF